MKDCVLVYFHTLTSKRNHLDSDVLKKLDDVIDVKYKRNLKAVYFGHLTFRSKVSTWVFFNAFSVPGLRTKPTVWTASTSYFLPSHLTD